MRKIIVVLAIPALLLLGAAAVPLTLAAVDTDATTAGAEAQYRGFAGPLEKLVDGARSARTRQRPSAMP